MADDDARALTQAVNNLTRVVTNLDLLLRRDYPKRAEIERRFQTQQSARRAIVQGAVLLLVVAVLAGYFNVQLAQQQACFGQQLADLSGTQSRRADLNEQESAQNRELWGVFAEAAGLVKDDPTQPLDQADQDRLNRKLVTQLLEYKREIGRINNERAHLPVTPYEAGSC